MDAKEVMLEGLNAALREATGNLYRVFASEGIYRTEGLDGLDHEVKFLRGVKKHRADYERMVAIVTSGTTR